jgi:hypothetical protein
VYDDQTSFSLTCVAVDKAGLKSTPITYTIRVTNVLEAPTVPAQTVIGISPLTKTGTEVAVLSVTKDALDTVSYYLRRSSPYFSLGLTTGKLVVATGLTVSTTDYNVSLSYYVVNSLGASSNVGNVTVNVIAGNVAPQVNSTTISVSEKTVNGSIIGAVVAQDPNGDKLTYSLGTASSVFAVNASTGVITLLRNLNYTRVQQYQLAVIVQDSGVGKLQAAGTVTINVLDRPDAPVLWLSLSSFSVSEAAVGGTNLTSHIIATDADASDVGKLQVRLGLIQR